MFRMVVRTRLARPVHNIAVVGPARCVARSSTPSPYPGLVGLVVSVGAGEERTDRTGVRLARIGERGPHLDPGALLGYFVGVHPCATGSGRDVRFGQAVV